MSRFLSDMGDDPLDRHYGVSSASMTAEIRRRNGQCVECGATRRPIDGDVCEDCIARWEAERRAQLACEHGNPDWRNCVTCIMDREG